MSRRAQSVNHDKYNSKCVCTICTCGIHKCPQKPHQRLRLESETTNQAFYKAHEVQRSGRWKNRPAPVMNSYDPDLLQSSYKSTYKGLPLLNSEQKSTVSDKLQTHKRIPFQGQSSYKSQYLINEINLQPRKRFQYQPNESKFEGQSQYKQNYQKQNQISNKNTLGSKSNGFDPITFQNKKRIPFEGQSSYKSQFKQHNIEQHPLRQQKYTPNPAKFQGQSHYKAFYPKHQIVSDVCPILQLPKIPREASPGKSHLNYVSEKNTWQ